MRDKSLAVLIAMIAAVSLSVPSRGFAAPENSINIGGGGMIGRETTASAFFVEYERFIGSRMSVLARAGKVSYEYDDDFKYFEEGDPRGVDIGVRAYPLGGGMKGFYIGLSVGSWNTDWTFTSDKGQAWETRGTGKTKAIRADVEVGGKFYLGSERVSLMPALHLGEFFSIDDSCSYTYPAGYIGTYCNRKSLLGFYGFYSLSVGISF